MTFGDAHGRHAQGSSGEAGEQQAVKDTNRIDIVADYCRK